MVRKSKAKNITLAISVMVAIVILRFMVVQAQILVGEIRAIAWSPDGTRIALAGGPLACDEPPGENLSLYAIHILDGVTGQEVDSFEGEVCPVNSIAWSPDGTQLASASDAGTARVWNATTGQRLVFLQNSYGRGMSVTGLAWSPDGQRMAHFIDEGRSGLYIWDPNTGQSLLTVNTDTESVAWNPDGSRLAVGNFNRTVQILEPETGQILTTFEPFNVDGRVVSVDWSPDGTKLAVSGIGLRILDSSTGQVLVDFAGHPGNSTIYVRWNPDGTRLATVGGLDNTIRVWDAETGEQLGLVEVGAPVWAVDWSPDGGRIAYGGADGLAQIVPIPI
jgi:WD40 repeat protein